MSSNDINQVLAQMRALAAAADRGPAKVPDDGNDTDGVDFGSMLKASIDQVNQTQQTAGNLTESFEKGDPQANLGEVMVALQKASLSFDTMTEVRNRLVSAYQDIMNMQV